MERWKEELTLVRYEMEWSVRYFHHQSRKWDFSADGIAGAHASNAGALAYAARKQTMWLYWARIADHAFSRCNLAYQSPLTL